MASHRKQFKLVLLGASSVGKSSVVLRFSRNEFNQYPESTIGAAFSSQSVPLNDKVNVTFDIWDTAGQEKYKSLAPMYYRDACAALVVFDITNIDTFKRAGVWVKELRQPTSACYEDITIALVGNKLDLASGRTVSTEEAKAYADKENLIYSECSAKTGDGINEVFSAIAKGLDIEKLRRFYGLDEVQKVGDEPATRRGRRGQKKALRTAGGETITLADSDYLRERKRKGCCGAGSTDELSSGSKSSGPGPEF